MARVKELQRTFYQIELLGDEYTLTEEDFIQLQEECREIAAYGKPEGTEDPVDKEPEPDILTRIGDARAQVEAVKAEVDEADLSQMETTAIPAPKPKRAPPVPMREVTRYARMIQEGKEKDAVKKAMLADELCAKNSLSYFYKRAEAEAAEMAPLEIKTKPEPRLTRLDFQDMPEALKKRYVKACYQTGLTMDQCRDIATWQRDLDDEIVGNRASNIGAEAKAAIRAYSLIHEENKS